MQNINIGKSGIAVPFLGMGTWAIGGGAWWGDNDDALSVKAIQTAVEQGIQWIDTAPIYGLYHSEEVVGEAMKHIDRDKVVLSPSAAWVATRDPHPAQGSGRRTGVPRPLRQRASSRTWTACAVCTPTIWTCCTTDWQSSGFWRVSAGRDHGSHDEAGRSRAKIAPSVLPTSLLISSGATAATASWTSFRKVQPADQRGLKSSCPPAASWASRYRRIPRWSRVFLTGKVTMDTPTRRAAPATRTLLPAHPPGTGAGTAGKVGRP